MAKKKFAIKTKTQCISLAKLYSILDEEFLPLRDRGSRNQLGFHQSRLTETITKNENSDYKKRISPYYPASFKKPLAYL